MRIDLPDPESVATEASRLIAEALTEGLDKRSQAVLAVSGGRTPVRTFELLSAADLDWSRVTVILVDERWVEPISPDSNERLVREHLLVGHAAKARFVPMKTEAAAPAEGLAACRAALAGLPQLDAALLGMGEDGHFASLFPGSPALADGLTSQQPCVAVPAGDNGEAPPQPRMSLTLPMIARAGTVILLTGGPRKLEVLDRALLGLAGPEELPITALLTARPDTIIVHSAV